MLDAAFGASIDTPTAVLEGEDGIFRIARVSDIVPEAVDGAYQAKIENDKIDLQAYRAVVAGDVIHEKLSDKIVADVTGPSLQRRVSEIYTNQAAADLGSDAIKVRHILYSPNGDPQNAAQVAGDDPAWQVAQAKALASYERIKANPALFDSIARVESDEDQAKGPTGSGGKLPYFDSKSSLDEAFLKAIMVPGLKDGQLLEPIKSAFGWHIIQVMNHPTDIDHLTALKDQIDKGGDFAVAARDNSYAPTAGKGGDMGWIVKGELDDKLTDAIYATPIGQTSGIVTVPDDGSYLFKVIGEETRTPEGRQLDSLKATAFSKWYDAKKSAATIVRESAPATTPSQ